MALSAAFDLEIRHYDALNAFINADINEEVYCSCPEGFNQPGQIWRLLKALYGLKQSPLLWYQHFTEALEQLGLYPVPGVNCLYANEWLILFFYVDDVVTVCHKQYVDKLKAFKQALFKKFKIRSIEDL